MGFKEHLLLQASAAEEQHKGNNQKSSNNPSQHPDSGRFKEVKTRFTLVSSTRVRYRGE